MWTMAVKASSATIATASSSCSSVQPGLARLLEQVARTLALLGERPQIAQQRRLAVVARVPLAGERELVEAEAGLAAGAAVQREPGLGAVVRRDGERDPLERLERQRAVVAQLRAEARVGAQGGRGAREDAEEVGELAGAGEARPSRPAATPRAPSGRRGSGTGTSGSSFGEPPLGRVSRGSARCAASLPLISVGDTACLRNCPADRSRGPPATRSGPRSGSAAARAGTPRR